MTSKSQDFVDEKIQEKQWRWYTNDEVITTEFDLSYETWLAMPTMHRHDHRFWYFLWVEPQSSWRKNKTSGLIGEHRYMCTTFQARLEEYVRKAEGKGVSGWRLLSRKSDEEQRNSVFSYLKHLVNPASTSAALGTLVKHSINTTASPTIVAQRPVAKTMESHWKTTWGAVLTGKTMEELRIIHELAQRAMSAIEFKNEETNRKHRVQAMKHIENIKQLFAKPNTNGKRPSQEDDTDSNDLRPSKRLCNPAASTILEQRPWSFDFLTADAPIASDRSTTSATPYTPVKHRLMDASPPRSEFKKLAGPLMPKPNISSNGVTTRSQTRAAHNVPSLDPKEPLVVKIMLENLRAANVDHIVAKPMRAGVASNIPPALRCKRVTAVIVNAQRAAVVDEETERQTLLAEVLRQKEELKKIKLEPED